MQLLLFTVALALIGLSSSQFFAAALQARRTERRWSDRRNRRLKKLRSATRVARLTSELDSTFANAKGNAWRVMEVVQVRQESIDTKSFTLVDPYQQDLPNFHPGQYLMIRPAMAGVYQTTRCYSLSVPPNPRLWRITVKNQSGDAPPRPDRKSGALSSWLHENINAGDCLLVGGPGGHFFLPPENSSPIVLLAAGVGITPMNSMLHYSITRTPRRPVSLYYQVKDLQHWPLGPEVHACAGKTSGCRIVTMISRSEQLELSPPVSHPGEFRSGRIDALAVVNEVNAADAHYFLCGPDGWMQQLRAGLSEAGVPEPQIHWESFGNGHWEASQAIDSKETHQVQFQRSSVTAQWESSEQSIWELAQANDVSIPSGCLSGVCGSCRVRVLSGSIQYDRQVQIILPEGECLSCIARPLNDLVIDA